MGVGYKLVNQTKKEQISFIHIPANTVRELAGNPVSAAIIAWYMLENRGDHIAFVSETYDDWPFPIDEKKDLSEYVDKTNEVVTSLINADILADDGVSWADEDEPDTVYERALRNKWMNE